MIILRVEQCQARHLTQNKVGVIDAVALAVRFGPGIGGDLVRVAAARALPLDVADSRSPQLESLGRMTVELLRHFADSHVAAQAISATAASTVASSLSLARLTSAEISEKACSPTLHVAIVHFGLKMNALGVN
jgi:hypothetical protein